ncbi:MAG: hypothetical protein FKY71_14945 [Spiribacter salinus]|uniref:Uncharacterized protein n=1 Tax=Spiribacter salinus TaxID=1335746 RepID=A0A540VN88_9GAMM|nr:MAG: hypothetical protein FKY71_14945 [Spiribacter salinus]
MACYICIILRPFQARISPRLLVGHAGLALFAVLLIKPIPGHTDLMLELKAGQYEASRILIKPPRVRVEYVGRHYQLFDRDQDAMVTVLEDEGVFYREEPEALSRARNETLEVAARFMRWGTANLERMPKPVFGAWSDLAGHWGLAEGDGLAPPAPPRVDAVDGLDETANAGGFECELHRVRLRTHADRIIACLAPRSTVGIAAADLAILGELFTYLERLRSATMLAPTDRLGLPPGLVAEVIDHTDKVVLALVNRDVGNDSLWEIDRLWSADLDDARFYLPDDVTQVVAPYRE